MVESIHYKESVTERFCVSAIIFRGTGARITQDEKESWHKDVDVFFQENAWADTPVCVDWVNRTLKRAVEDTDRFVLFCDNLSAQVSDEFKEAVSAIRGVVWFDVPNATDLWKPVDAGFAELVKKLAVQEHHKWLDSEENADRWYGNTEPFSAKERRVLISHWTGNAYNRIVSEHYKSFVWRVWEKTGCLITADGSDDAKIQPEGLPAYKVQPPLPIDAANAAPTSNVTKPAEQDQEGEAQEAQED